MTPPTETEWVLKVPSPPTRSRAGEQAVGMEAGQQGAPSVTGKRRGALPKDDPGWWFYQEMGQKREMMGLPGDSGRPNAPLIPSPNSPNGRTSTRGWSSEADIPSTFVVRRRDTACSARSSEKFYVPHTDGRKTQLLGGFSLKASFLFNKNIIQRFLVSLLSSVHSQDKCWRDCNNENSTMVLEFLHK